MKKIVFFTVAVVVACLSANAQLTTKASKAREAAQQPSRPQVKMERIEKIEPATGVRFNPNLIPVKKVFSSEKLKDGSEFRIVLLENGMVKKQLLRAGEQSQRKIQPRMTSAPNAAPKASAASESLFEGFEGWDETTWDWLPQGWTERSDSSSGSSIKEVSGERLNFTWRTSDWSKTGQYSAGVQFAFPVDTLNNNNDTVRYEPRLQDEWLISPQVTVRQTDYVFAFDLYYDPFWTRAEYHYDELGYLILEGKYSAMHTVVEALISDDGGATWTRKWDNRADAAGYSPEELRYIFDYGASWLRVSINLEEYHNRDIQIAIRYRDDGGESVYVDNVTVGYVIPEVSYRRPSGYLISGLTTDYRSLNMNLIVGHAYMPTLWTGDVKYQETVSWSFNDYEGSPIQTSDEKNPTVSLPYDLYDTPLLTASGKGNTQSEFQLGISVDTEVSRMGLGGQNIWPDANNQDVVIGLGNYDLQYRITILPFLNADSLAILGTTFRGVANYFEKPVAKYLFETFYVHALNVTTLPAGEPVKLDIYAMNRDSTLGNIIASSEAYPEDFIDAGRDGNGNKYYTIPFRFMVTDSATGRESESYLEIDDQFMAEFYNYRSADVPCQYYAHPTGEIYAYVSFEEGLLPLGATSFLFDMDAQLPFMYAEENQFAVPDAGGDKDFHIVSWWKFDIEGDEDGWWLKEELPDWIRVAEIVQDEENGMDFTMSVNVDPLPAGVSGRNANVTFQAPGCEMTLQFKQGDSWFTGIGAVNSNSVKVFSQGDRFVLTYPAGTTSVAVYTVAGQKIAGYTLNSTGTYSIPADRLPKGIYILKFAGQTNEAVKVVK